MSTDQNMDQLCISTMRTLSIDAIQKANSGHPGTPLDAAPFAYTLWQQFLRFDPADPARFTPFGMDDRALECPALARDVTGNPDGFIYVDELEQLLIDGWVEETQAPDGWTGFIGGTPPLQAPLIVNCPTHISVDLRE